MCSMNCRAIIVIVFLFFLQIGDCIAQQEINLAGRWGFETDVMDFRRMGVEIRGDGELHDSITLPGITDQYQVGNRTTYKHYDRLTRKYEYMAPAWYRKRLQIPESWSGKRIHLYLERAHWLTAIYRGRTEVNRNDYISVPHWHDLTDYLKPGQENVIDLLIDNRYQYNTHKWDHAHTEFTQINWNGVIGEVKLIALDPVYIDDLQLYPDVQKQQVTVRLSLVNTTGKPFSGKALLEVTGEGLEMKKEVKIASADSLFALETTLVLGKKMKLWDEFFPNLYKLKCSLSASGEENVEQVKELHFGMREVKAVGEDILLNGHRLHLRGTVNNAEFPLTGHVPMDDASCARKHVKAEQFYISHRSDKGSVTIYEGKPATDWDINAGHGTGQPIISHETGQRCVYPDFNEISTYTGPVEARNLELYRDSLAVYGMANLADDFFRVSGQQTRIEYKDVIEGQLRSSLSSGFQLLSLIDFPGQGYAPVGILNVFWKSKGFITPEKFREFCAPLLRPEAVKGRKSVFHNHFWNPIMFKWQPLTLGYLIHTEQPMFADFVTEDYLDWQWWDILGNAKVIEMDTAPDTLRPFIQSIDTYQHNHKLGIGFEARLHGGNLLVLAMDVEKDIDQRPASLQLLRSISRYVRSSQFHPVVEIDEAFIDSFLTPQSDTEEKEKVQDDFLNSFQNK